MSSIEQGLILPPNVVGAISKSVKSASSMGGREWAAATNTLGKGWKPFQAEQDSVAAWNFTRKYGSLLKDLSHEGNNLTLSGDVVKIGDGPFGHSYEFDGTDDYLATSGNPTSLQVIGELTVETIVKFDALDTRYIISKWDEGDSNRSWKLGTEGGDLVGRISSDGTTETSVTVDDAVSPISITLYIALTYKPETYIRLFVNGCQVAENTTTIPSSLYNCNQNVTIGGFWSTSTLNGDYDGHIYFIQLTPRAKSTREIWRQGGRLY